MLLRRLMGVLRAGDPCSRTRYTHGINGCALVESVHHRPFEPRVITGERLEPFGRSCSAAVPVCGPVFASAVETGRLVRLLVCNESIE